MSYITCFGASEYRPAKRVVLSKGRVVGYSDIEVAASVKRLDANVIVDCTTNPLLAAKEVARFEMNPVTEHNPSSERDPWL